jgi:hypothetical protein
LAVEISKRADVEIDQGIRAEIECRSIIGVERSGA